MPSTPKNPLDQPDRQGTPNIMVKPTVPPYDGGQFARDSMTPEEIGITRDRYYNEIPSDRPYHDDTTPGHSNQSYMGRQFDTQVREGTGYGIMVADKGQSPSRETADVNVHSADRGRDA